METLPRSAEIEVRAAPAPEQRRVDPLPPAGEVPLDALGLLWVLMSGIAQEPDGTTPVASLADHVHTSVRVIQRLLRVLEEAEMIERRAARPGGANRIAILTPSVRKAA